MRQHDDEAVHSFYEDVEPAMAKTTTQFIIVIGAFSAKVCTRKWEKGQFDSSE